MKKSNFITTFIIILFFMACEKPDHPKPDYIIPREINKTITVSQNDTVLRNVIFTVTDDDTDGIHAYVYRVKEDPNTIGQGNSDFLINGDKIIVLNHNDTISSASIGTWGNKEKLYIDGFAGKGEKYIGFRLGPAYPLVYFYYWIKISLSSEKKTLNIIGNIPKSVYFLFLLISAKLYILF